MSKLYYRNQQAIDTYLDYVNDLSALPFCFTYGGKEYANLSAFREMRRIRETTAGKETDTITLMVDDNLQITVIMSVYPKYGAHEWTVWFTNVGNNNTDIIGGIKAVNMRFAGENPVLKGILGDHENFYRPYAYDIQKQPVHFKSEKGRPTHIYFPYFNLEHGNGGTLIALGWGGTWEAEFIGDDTGARFSGTGCIDLETYLKPGESIRSALVAMIPYNKRDEDYATNLWRSWFINCNMPKKNAHGDPLEPFSTTCFAFDTGLPNSDGSISERHFTWKPSLDKMLEKGFSMDYRWVDAGWYCDPNGNTVESDWWGTIGTWQLDPAKWPGKSFQESVEAFHAHGIKTFMWFEPERVTNVDGLVKNFGYKKEWAINNGRNVIVNNIGDSECLQWTLNRIIATMGENGVDMYREDNNADHISCWAIKDLEEGENRKGITENKSVVGHYRLWDGIIDYCRKHGRDTFVDSCASGGGRNDLESMRRGVPILRSDYDRTTTALRLSMTTSFNKWIPLTGAASTEQAGQLDPDGKRDKYILRASYNPIFNVSAQWTQDPNTDFDLIRFGMDEWKAINHYFLKDFYLLTPWRSQEDRTHWASYAYHDHDTDSGVLLAFRMEEAKDTCCVLKLRMLEPNRNYEISDADKGVIGCFSGAKLREGYKITLDQPRAAALITYRASDAILS